MGKVSYTNLKLKVNDSIRELDFDGTKIEVKQYLSSENKYDLIMSALAKSEENGYYNDILLEMYFNLNIIYLYTNISFTEKQREDEFKLYDQLQSNDLIDKVISTMNTDEYKYLTDSLELIKHDILVYKNSAGAILNSAIKDLPTQAAAAMEIVNNFDPQKFNEVIEFAKAVNNGNPIPSIVK